MTLVDFHGNLLHADEALALTNLESQLGISLPLLPDIWNNAFGFVVEGGHITQLTLRKRGLTSIPPSIFQFLQLRVLLLVSNQIAEIPELIKDLRDLEIIDMFFNKITTVSRELWRLPNLRKLFLSGNPIKILPPDIREAKKLQELSISEIGVITLPKEIVDLDDLRELSASDNLLKELPEDIGKLQNLEKLFIINNHITSLPATIGLLQNLKILSVMSNQITILPASICQLKNLETLGMDHNKLKILPKCLGSLPRLTTLGVSFNQLRGSSFPHEVFNLRNLKRLDIEGNIFPYSPIPPHQAVPPELEPWLLALHAAGCRVDLLRDARPDLWPQADWGDIVTIDVEVFDPDGTVVVPRTTTILILAQDGEPRALHEALHILRAGKQVGVYIREADEGYKTGPLAGRQLDLKVRVLQVKPGKRGP